MKPKTLFRAGLLAFSIGASVACAATVDSIVTGNDPSEKAHAFQSDQSEIIEGGLKQPARRLLPRSPASINGGEITFRLKVDPRAQNYLTVKLWGSDKGSQCGRLLLFADGLQVGYRHEGDYDVLNQCDDEAEAPGRFVYETVPLPVTMTTGKAELMLSIHSLGPMWPYGATFAQYQKDLVAPSRGIYCVYVSTDSCFNPPRDEAQGQRPATAFRPGPGEEVIEQSKQIVNERLTRLLDTPPTGAAATDLRGRFARMLLLAAAYNTDWTVAHADHRAIDQIAHDADAVAQDAANDPKFIGRDWPGAGPMGEAIISVWPALQDRLADTSRKHAWSQVLRASVDYWRTHRRNYTNQSMIVDRNIYTANRALEMLDPSHALPEEKVLRFVYEAMGIEPWLGSDTDLKSNPSNDDPPGHTVGRPFGEHYALVTRKGLSRELGWVGTYGETILHFAHDLAVLTGDEKVRAQLRLLEDARMRFRYPGFDADGFSCMKLVSEIDNRTAHYPLAGAAYTAPNIREEWWMDVPALLADDPVAVGAAQQSLEERQYFAYIDGRLKDPDTLGMMRNVDEYEKVKSLPPSADRLPMSYGQPDFAWADEQDAVLAIKRGDTRLFVNLYYRAERAVNDVARIAEFTPSLTRLVTAKTKTMLNSSGQTYTRPDWIDAIRSRGLPPPDETIHQAWAGQQMPIAARPPDAAEPKYGDWGPFVGKASFYQLQYGDYLILMNSSERKDMTVPVPEAARGVVDLITNRPIPNTATLTLAPLSTVVLYTGK